MKRPTWHNRQMAVDLDGQDIATFDIYLDWEAVERMVVRAATSKGKAAQDGPIRVVVTKRTGATPRHLLKRS